MLKKLAAAGVFLLASLSIAHAEPFKVGFVYVGPIGDHGWTYICLLYTSPSPRD